MNAIDIMNRPVLAAAKSTSARDLAIQMLMGGFSGIPITDRDGTVVGLVSELDIIRALRAGKPLDTITAAEIMTAEVITVNVDATVEEIMEIMDTKQIVRVPVLEDGKLLERPVSDAMQAPFPVVDADVPLDRLTTLLSKETPAALVREDGQLVGIVNRYDVLRQVAGIR